MHFRAVSLSFVARALREGGYEGVRFARTVSLPTLPAPSRRGAVKVSGLPFNIM